MKKKLRGQARNSIVQIFRTHPRGRLVGFPIESRPLHDALWQRARGKGFTFRKLYDARAVVTMASQGVLAPTSFPH